ncbi:hypothetical protein [uncultured Treponema sp.]|nr:hypothetical protein [uncultured Treponema sp.]
MLNRILAFCFEGRVEAEEVPFAAQLLGESLKTCLTGFARHRRSLPK